MPQPVLLDRIFSWINRTTDGRSRLDQTAPAVSLQTPQSTHKVWRLRVCCVAKIVVPRYSFDLLGQPFTPTVVRSSTHTCKQFTVFTLLEYGSARILSLLHGYFQSQNILGVVSHCQPAFHDRFLSWLFRVSKLHASHCHFHQRLSLTQASRASSQSCTRWA